MDITEFVAALRIQLLNINQAILALEKVSTSRPRRRGRPPKKFCSKSGVANGSIFLHHPKTMSATGNW
jgi:hypothetical protein